MQVTGTTPKKIEQKKQKKPGLWDQLVFALIRPPRHKYCPTQLGTKINCGRGATFTRQDLRVTHYSKDIEISLYLPPSKPHRLLLYLHGNSSSRLEALSLLEYLPCGFGLAAFDFLGCGLSNDQYISLGVRQAQQIATVTEYLKTCGYYVVLWGRSMGAVSALRYGRTDIIVADSPFVSLQKICKETAQDQKPKYFPGCMVQCCFPVVFSKLRKDVKKRADFDMKDLNTKKAVANINKSNCLVFLSGTQDKLINHKHSKQLYQTFQGENKRIYLFEGTHNSKRPADIMLSVMQYIDEMANRYDPPPPPVETQDIQVEL